MLVVLPSSIRSLQADAMRNARIQSLLGSSMFGALREETAEFILEGLHLHKLLNKYDHAGTATYTG